MRKLVNYPHKTINLNGNLIDKNLGYSLFPYA